MTINDFFNAYEGLWIETNKTSDTSTLDQCIDAWRTYNRKVVGAPDIFGNPPDIWANYQQDFYEKIANTPDGVPKLGDVIIWGTKYGPYGHIAVCTDIADTKTFTSFDQNDPTGEPCHYQPHTYSGVLGWLRPKVDVVGHPDENIVLQVITGAYSNLPDGDSLKEGNLEGYARAIVDEHLAFKGNESMAKQLEGFVETWVGKFSLESGSDIADVIAEMNKLLPLEDTVNQYREAIERVVGQQVTDEALLLALEAVKKDISTLNTKLTECQLKLKKNGAIQAFEFWKYVIKVYNKSKTNE